MIFLSLLLSHQLFYYLCSLSLFPFSHPWCIFLLIFDDPLMWPILTLLCLSDCFCSFCLLPFLLCFCLSSNVLPMFLWALIFFCNGFVEDGVVEIWYHCYFFKNVVPFRCALLNVYLPILCRLLYFCTEWRSQGNDCRNDWLKPLCCVCAFRRVLNGFPLSLRRCFQFPCLLHTKIFNGSFVNVHMIGWIKLQRWN